MAGHRPIGHLAAGPQVARELFARRAPRLHEEREVDRLVGHAPFRLVGMGAGQPAHDLLRRPAESQLGCDEAPQAAALRQLRNLGSPRPAARPPPHGAASHSEHRPRRRPRRARPPPRNTRAGTPHRAACYPGDRDSTRWCRRGPFPRTPIVPRRRGVKGIRGQIRHVSHPLSGGASCVPQTHLRMYMARSRRRFHLVAGMTCNSPLAFRYH